MRSPIVAMARAIWARRSLSLLWAFAAMRLFSLKSALSLDRASSGIGAGGCGRRGTLVPSGAGGWSISHLAWGMRQSLRSNDPISLRSVARESMLDSSSGQEVRKFSVVSWGEIGSHLVSCANSVIVVEISTLLIEAIVIS